MLDALRDAFMSTPVEDLLVDITAVATAAKRARLQGVIKKKLQPLLGFDEAAIFTLDRRAESVHHHLFLSTAHPFAGEAPVLTESVVSGAEPRFTADAAALTAQLFTRADETAKAGILRIDLHAPNNLPSPDKASTVQASEALKKAGFISAIESPFKHGDTEGIMAFWSAEKALLRADKELLAKVMRQVAVAVDYILSAERLEAERRNLQLQIAVSNALATGATWRERCIAVAAEINTIVPHRLLGITLIFSSGLTRVLAFAEKQPNGSFTFLSRDERDQLGSISETEMAEMRQDMAEVFESNAAVYAGREFDKLCARYPLAEMSRMRFGVNAAMVVPIQVAANCVATLVLSDAAPDAFTRQNLRAVQALVPQISLALNNFFAYEEVESLNRHLTSINQAVTPVQTREQIVKIISEKLRNKSLKLFPRNCARSSPSNPLTSSPTTAR